MAEIALQIMTATLYVSLAIAIVAISIGLCYGIYQTFKDVH